ncbi:MAG TPA: winged helix-turn-helix domain-containing protein [Bacteroidales bacterium]|nr:winged helix-turn-helix domain-containing protein [Bacteroidales bacterium]HPS16960.1 winged helix-turn-helix domain-containing protein [Bacteroidales bacterium]
MIPENYNAGLNTEKEVYQISRFTFDYEDKMLVRENSKKRLTNTEAHLLKMFYENKNQILPRELALNTIWGDSNYFLARSMDVYISKLRKYLSADDNISIINVRKKGYKMDIK